MANITDQFVTSFSELHINASKLPTIASGTAGDTIIRNFFTGATTGASVVVLGTVTSGDLTASTSFTVVDTTGTSVFFVTDATTASGTTILNTVAEIIALTTVTFVGAQVPLVMEIGTLSNEATVIDTPTFGELYRGKLRGQLDGGQLDSQLYWAPQNFVHELLRTLAEDGNSLSVGIKWNRTANGSDSEYVVFNSFVSSFGIDTTFDDVAKVSSTFVVDGAEHFASDE